MKKSTGVILVLIIVLLLGVIGVGGYFLVKGNNDTNKEIGELKNEIAGFSKNTENTTSEPTKNTENNNNNVNTNTSAAQQNISTENNKKTTKTYTDIQGTYESQYTLILSEKGTFAYYDYDTESHYVGYYTIVNDKVTLNSVVFAANDPSANLSNETMELILNSDGTITSNGKGFFEIEHKSNIKFTKKSGTPREDVNIANVIDSYLAGCRTTGKDGQGPWFSGLSK